MNLANNFWGENVSNVGNNLLENIEANGEKQKWGDRSRAKEQKLSRQEKNTNEQ